MVLASTIDFTLPLADPVLKFLLILLIILAAPLLLNKLRIPHLLGLIIAGAIIGPHGFNPVSYTHLDVYKRQPPKVGLF